MPRSVNLGRGVIVPYPEPTSPEATAIGKANRRADTKCEVRLRQALHALGLRFRKDLLIRAGSVRTKADVVFTRARVAVFVDGCFWHVCPEHFHMPKSNLGYWEPKLRANVERDERATAALEGDGWEVVRIWEHVPPDDAAEVVVARLVEAGHPTAARLAVARPS
jgi:DNA mismatch endonuclease (patch repair protein)